MTPEFYKMIKLLKKPATVYGETKAGSLKKSDAVNSELAKFES